MSLQFYENILSFFSMFTILILFVLGATELLLLYFFTKNVILYYAYVAFLFTSLMYGTRAYKQFREFKENLYLFIPSEGEEKLEPLSLEVEDLPLKVAFYYRNGASLTQIKEDLGFSHPTQVKRELVKGLDILLQNYQKHEGKVET